MSLNNFYPGCYGFELVVVVQETNDVDDDGGSGGKMKYLNKKFHHTGLSRSFSRQKRKTNLINLLPSNMFTL